MVIFDTLTWNRKSDEKAYVYNLEEIDQLFLDEICNVVDWNSSVLLQSVDICQQVFLQDGITRVLKFPPFRYF